MAKFLTTRRIALSIEELIENAKEEIFLITPYLQLSPTYFDRLMHAVKQGVTVTVIYGKADLNYKEEKLLKELNCNLYFKDNLHSKCYSNEKTAIVTSLNLYSYSEVHNEEMGILLDYDQDAEAYKDCRRNISLLQESAVIKQMSTGGKKKEDAIAKEKFQLALTPFQMQWLNCLKSSFTNCVFEEGERFVYAKDFLKKGMEFTTENGFATIRLNIPWEVGQKLSREHSDTFSSVLSSYRFYWSSPFTKVSLYHSKNRHFKTTEEEVIYCATGVTKLLSCLKSINVF
jgi:hypothetical protein